VALVSNWQKCEARLVGAKRPDDNDRCGATGVQRPDARQNSGHPRLEQQNRRLGDSVCTPADDSALGAANARAHRTLKIGYFVL
jgi:hypothetical protein